MPEPAHPALSPIYLAGPTASGKSAVALLLAGTLPGEIISVDSMQVYRGMDIGTSKPTPAERARVIHHLLDVCSLTETFDAARFLRLAKIAEAEIQARGKVPIYIGGTGFYFKALAAGIGTAPPGDPTLRAELEQTPREALLEELKRADSATYEKIDKQNLRRVVRAVEVIRLTGRPFAASKAAWSKARPQGIWLGIKRDRKDLCQRIDARVDSMFKTGLVEETQKLLEHGLETNATAMQALGYRQVAEFLRGERDLAATIALVKEKTRQYAKRQMTWFQRQLALQWLEVDAQDTPESIALRALLKIQSHPQNAQPCQHLKSD